MRLVECLKTTLVIEQVTAKDVPNKEIIRPACDVTSLINAGCRSPGGDGIRSRYQHLFV